MYSVWSRILKKFGLSFLIVFFSMFSMAVVDVPVLELQQTPVVSVAYADSYMSGVSDAGKQTEKIKDGKLQIGNSGIFKSLEDVFATLATEGVGRLRNHILALIGLFGIISFCTNWSLYEGQMRLSMIISTILKVGFFMWLAVNWVTIADAIYESLAKLGILAAGLSAADYDKFAETMNGSTIVDRGFYSVKQLWDGLGSASKGLLGLTAEIVMRILALILILFAHFWIAFEVFITRIEFRIFECLSFVFLPFGVFQATSFLFQKCVSGVFSYGAKLLVLSFLVAMVENAVDWDSNNSTSALNLGKESTAGDMLLVAVSMLMIAYLVSKSGQLAAAMASGSPSLDGKGFASGVVGKVAGGTAFLGASYMANAGRAAGALATAGQGAAEGSAVSQAAGAGVAGGGGGGGGILENLATGIGAVMSGGASMAGQAALSAAGVGGSAATMFDAVKSSSALKGEASKTGVKSDSYYDKLESGMASKLEAAGMSKDSAKSTAASMVGMEKTKDAMMGSIATAQQAAGAGGAGGAAQGKPGAAPAGGSDVGTAPAGASGPESTGDTGSSDAGGVGTKVSDPYANSGKASEWINKGKSVGAALGKVSDVAASYAKAGVDAVGSTAPVKSAKQMGEKAGNAVDAAGRLVEQSDRGVVSNLNEALDSNASAGQRAKAAGAAVVAAGRKLGPSEKSRKIMSGMLRDIGRAALYSSAPFKIVHGAFDRLQYNENIHDQWKKTDTDRNATTIEGKDTVIKAGERKIFRPDVPPSRWG